AEQNKGQTGDYRGGRAGNFGQGGNWWYAERIAPRVSGDRCHYELYEYLQSLGDDGSGPGRQEGGRARFTNQALGQNQPGARLEGGHGLFDASRVDAFAGAITFSLGRVWLHDVYRRRNAHTAGEWYHAPHRTDAQRGRD